MNTNTISYGSVCSGIEAASIAWEVLGFNPAWFSEIESFPSAVLAHHWPQTANLGDMTQLAAQVRAGDIAAPDILVGGTPCQAFSVAGARAGLSDPRGQLTISYGELADAIDDRRTAAGLPPAIIVWENVPGVLSSKDNAFGAFLGLLAGEDCELQPPGKRWANSGCVLRGKRAIAWRVLDAQYFGVAQRRRRVFVVASARTDIDPAKILFESEGVRRDIAPRRETGKAVAALTASGVGTCGAGDNQGPAGHLITAFGGGNCSGEIEIATACTAHGLRMDFDTETFLAQYSSTDRHGVSQGMSVRRLTPVECERLQGFPDNHTLIPGDKRKQITDEEYVYLRHHFPLMTAEEAYRRAADGPRYKAIGNSMAVPVMRWIGARIMTALSECHLLVEWGAVTCHSKAEISIKRFEGAEA